ncbi:MAG: DUF6318 family protein [Dermatophilaceae bacterium]
MGCIGTRAAARSGFRPITSVVTALSAGAVLLVGACTPSPQPTPTSTTSATVSTSPTAPTSTTSDPPTSNVPTTDPGFPPAARVDSIEGAQEFVKYFMAQLNRSWTEADPTLIVPLCLPTSKTCAAYIGKAKDYRDRGLRYVGIPVEVQSVQGFEWISGSAAVRVRGKQSSGKVVDSNGSVVQEAPANSGSVVFQLEHNGLWRVSEIQGEAVTR